MRFFEDKVRNSFDAMFDFNEDGNLDFEERAAQLEFIEEEELGEKWEDSYDNHDDSYDDNYDDDYNDNFDDDGFDSDSDF